MEYIKTAHSIYYFEYHVAWIFKYRRWILNPGMCGYIRKILSNLSWMDNIMTINGFKRKLAAILNADAFWSSIVPILPKQIKSIIKAMLHLIIGTREIIFPSVWRVCKQRYGNQVILRLDKRDEMLTAMSLWYKGKKECQLQYFQSGETALNVLVDVLTDLDVSFENISSFLDFACGYGRITRFVVTRLDPRRITVSDIDQEAVKFNSKTFGCNPLLSKENPSQFFCDQKFQIIFVASLFSHLNINLWKDWLGKLYDLLESGGYLIFSTHGQNHNLPEEIVDKPIEDGFWFKSRNETRGRLNEDVYGTAWVTEAWVRKCIEKRNLGQFINFYPAKLWIQDIYVVLRP